MLILLEGGDGTGKTTLARELVDLTGGQYLHASAPTRHPLVEYTAPLAEYKRGSGQTIVCDRWHVGELVYGPRYRGKCGLTWTQFCAVDEFLYGLGAVLVWMTHDVETQVSRLLERGEAPDWHQLADENEAFCDAVRETDLPVINCHANWTTAERILHEARRREEQV